MMTSSWRIGDIASQHGRRVIVTGGNSGIGYHAAAVLARQGAHVVLACRDETRGEQAAKRIERVAPGAQVEVARLDLASLASVRAFAAHQLDAGPLDILVNNAGVLAPATRMTTVDGFELQFGTNVLGHFALTALLMPALEQAARNDAARPRVVTIASIAHKTGRLDFDDLQAGRHYRPMVAYRQSKLADLMFALELNRRLRAAKSRVMSVAAHPGVANTNLFRADHFAGGRMAQSFLNGFIGTFLNSDFDGALPTLYAATSNDVVDGGYYGPGGIFEARGQRVGVAKIASHARDEADAKRLWDVCEALTGSAFERF
jgi:NAD(P)-dependent dehydrogenase (short-subunit alcohol dehydrogenase family)